MRELSHIDAPALRALACLCLSDPSNPTNPGYGVSGEDVAGFLWPDADPKATQNALIHLASLRDAGYARSPVARGGKRRWTPTARGWQAALMPQEVADVRAH